MPEGDTVHKVARGLHAALAGQAITRSDVRVPRFALTDLSGQAVREVVARGKHILLRTDAGVTLHSHLKMEGEWHVDPLDRRPRGPAHEVRVILETPAQRATGLRLAEVALVRTDAEDTLVGHLGPDPLGPDWDPAEAEKRLRAQDSERPIAEALLDQRVIAGIGNVYKSEICFLRGLDPRTPIGEVADLGAIVTLTKRLFDVNRPLGNQITTGDTRPGRGRWVYGRDRKPCRRCGTPIRVADRGRSDARVTFWCPSCQPAR